MAPHKAADARLEDVLEAATTVFARKGYRRAQVQEIASLAGVSAGTVYNHVPSKDALFRAVMERAIDGPARRPPRRARTAKSPDETIRWVAQRLDFVSDFPVLEAALANDHTAAPADEVAAVFGELFDVLLRTRHAAAILERSAPDMPQIRNVFRSLRSELFARMTRYVTRRVDAGVFDPIVDPKTTARLLVEATSWATHGRLNDRDPESALSDEAARAAVVEIAVKALTGSRMRSKPKEGHHETENRSRA
jgi:AcrR family transcriptional regulator